MVPAKVTKNCRSVHLECQPMDPYRTCSSDKVDQLSPELRIFAPLDHASKALQLLQAFANESPRNGHPNLHLLFLCDAIPHPKPWETQDAGVHRVPKQHFTDAPAVDFAEDLLR